jgi:hypothetical protein
LREVEVDVVFGFDVRGGTGLWVYRKYFDRNVVFVEDVFKSLRVERSGDGSAEGKSFSGFFEEVSHDILLC